MRLYTRTGATQISDPQFGTFTADANGAFDLPNELSDRLHSFHVNGVQSWESDAERAKRLLDEQMEKLRDPATLLATMQEMARSQQDLTAALLGAQSAPAAAVPATGGMVDPNPGTPVLSSDEPNSPPLVVPDASASPSGEASGDQSSTSTPSGDAANPAATADDSTSTASASNGQSDGEQPAAKPARKKATPRATK